MIAHKYIKFRLIGICYHILKYHMMNYCIFYEFDDNQFIHEYLIERNMNKEKFIKISRNNKTLTTGTNTKMLEAIVEKHRQGF